AKPEDRRSEGEPRIPQVAAVGRLNISIPSRSLIVLAGLLVLVQSARPSETDALAISANIRAKHMPFGTVLDPIYAAPDSDQIAGYTHCGDSALWTGAYLAAEAF